MMKSGILSLLMTVGVFCHLSAQNSNADSLKGVLSQSKEDTAKVNILISLSKAYVNSSPEVALSYGKQAKKLADSLHFTVGAAYALKYIGIYYYNQAKGVETLDNWLQSLNLFRSVNDKLGISNMLNNIGSLYYNQADDVKALDYYLQSLKISESLGDKLRIATALQNIGNTYLRTKANHPKALGYLLRALPLSKELGNQDAIVTINTNLGEVYYSKWESDSSKASLDTALMYDRNALKASNNSEEVSTSFILNNIGKAYAAAKNFNLAIRYQKQSVELTRKLKANYYLGKSLLGLADTYRQAGDISSALATYKEGESYLKEAHAVEELKDTYDGLTKAYSSMGNDKKAFFYQTLYTNYKDSLFTIDREKKISSLQFDFDISKKQSEINLLTKDQALQELDLQKQKTTRNAFAVGFLLILIIAFVLYRGYRNKVKTNLILDKQKAQIENLMLNILPEEVAVELQEQGYATPRYYENVSVLFTDFKSFTRIADKMSAKDLIEELNQSFIAFDDIIERNDLEKIKTIGDAYMCAGGIPTEYENHTLNMVKAGLEMQQYIEQQNEKRRAMGEPLWELRIGIHVGPVVAGVVGKKKYAYDIWGNTVNIASRMESNGEPGRVNISSTTYESIRHHYNCTHRGKISAKNVGEIDMYFVDGIAV
ncbi:MAG: tetratricopeptide repeat protein [Bacteroidota bacterium]|nr:tetratricopeptide repeat protein [Bacteroidota bacterium]